MSRQTQQVTASTKPVAAGTTGILQRKCASCGNHTAASGKCEECDKPEGLLQRKAVNHGEPEEVPPIVHDVLRSPGQPLDEETRAFFEPRFGYDFSQVRIHRDARAAESARQVNALAYTAGRNIIFGDGLYAPTTFQGTRLLAHELTHVVQQRNFRDTTAVMQLGEAHTAYEHEADAQAATIATEQQPPSSFAALPSERVQRSFLSGLLDVALFIPRLFGLDTFPSEDLREYLEGLQQKRGPEGGLFSDNKARACVVREGELGPYKAETKIWLIEDMLQGWTSSRDERAVINLLRRSAPERQQIVSAIGRDRLWSNFSGGNRHIIEALTLTATDAGDALVSRLRNLDLSDLQRYAANATDPAVQDSIRRATALARMTAPVPASAVITPAGEANLTINGVRVIVEPDRIDPSLGDHAFTYANFGWNGPGLVTVTEENADLLMGDISSVDVSVRIRTDYPSKEAESGQPGYGVGTRPQDEHTLRYHERSHGADWFTFLRNNPPPVFHGAPGMRPAQFNASVQEWNTAMKEYGNRATQYTIQTTDCVGKLPTNEQLAGTGFTAAICHQR